MNKRTRALSITPAVRGRVLERDGGKCVLCGAVYGLQCGHYIGRAQSGKGTEKNLVTLCVDCHRAYDQSAERERIRQELSDYLRSKYNDWDERVLVYHKWED